jgi:hypothetical protein
MSTNYLTRAIPGSQYWRSELVMAAGTGKRLWTLFEPGPGPKKCQQTMLSREETEPSD